MIDYLIKKTNDASITIYNSMSKGHVWDSKTYFIIYVYVCVCV
jgi:hypothetical protein